jgi:hypothetical protein
VTDPIQRLRDAGRSRLAGILEREWSTPLGEYSARLYEHWPVCPMEDALLAAFRDELQRTAVEPAGARRILDDLAERRVLQTATHLTATEGPTFLAVHRAATAGLPADTPYLVAAYSNVPFANPAWSGCLNFSDRHGLDALIDPGHLAFSALQKDARNRARDSAERRISLVPARMRDARVYRAVSPDRLHALCQALRPVLQRMGSAPAHDSFSNWALSFCRAATARALGRERIVFIDLNEVITGYLLRVLPESSHPLHRLLFDQNVRERVAAALGEDLALFTVPASSGKRERMANVSARDDAQLADPESVCRDLQNGRLCPGLLLTFGSLAFLNGFRCLGSFEQVEYLGRFQSRLIEAGWPGNEIVRQVDTAALTSGRCLDDSGEPVYPLDIVLGTTWRWRDDMTVGELFSPLLSRLV